jgi:DNA-binding transcriptional LysR family regulator
MELMQLEMFVAVVEERSVKRAAERVFRTQPAVSLALAKLERGIGTVLLDRSRRKRFELTNAGEVLYEYASRIIGLRNEVLSLFKEESVGSTGRLCIGVTGARNLRWISQFTSPFSQRYPNVRIELLSDRPEKLIGDLLERKIDFALLPAQPESQGMNADLVMTPVSGLERDRSLWIVQRRVGCSHLKKAFEEMLMSPARFRASGPSHPRLSKPNAHLRKLRAQKSK